FIRINPNCRYANVNTIILRVRGDLRIALLDEIVYSILGVRFADPGRFDMNAIDDAGFGVSQHTWLHLLQPHAMHLSRHTGHGEDVLLGLTIHSDEPARSRSHRIRDRLR